MIEAMSDSRRADKKRAALSFAERFFALAARVRCLHSASYSTGVVRVELRQVKDLGLRWAVKLATTSEKALSERGDSPRGVEETREGGHNEAPTRENRQRRRSGGLARWEKGETR